MFIAHLPAGYILASTVRSRTLGSRAVMSAALLGSIAPDLDLFYYYTLDACRHHHHSYWTHYPSVWLALMLAAWSMTRLKRWSKGGMWLLIAAGSGFLHILLDCIVGDIPLFAPWSARFYALATVPASVRPWWLNFLLHWSFLLELAVIGTAIWLFCIRRAGRRPSRPGTPQ